MAVDRYPVMWRETAAGELTVEREGPGPARLIYCCEEDGRETFCAVTMEDDQLRIERNIVYVPAQTAAVPLPADPQPRHPQKHPRGPFPFFPPFCGLPLP